MGPIGQRVVVTSNSTLDYSSWNATVLIRVDHPEEPLHLGIRQDSNTAQDFALFVMEMIERGVLQRGDTLVYDNATVHISAEVFNELHTFMTNCGVRGVPLPTYSPELNPIERCFNVVKHYLRYRRDPSAPLLRSIIRGFARVTQKIVAAEYLYSAHYILDHLMLLPPPLRALIQES